jgi:hypothetical protein
MKSLRVSVVLAALLALSMSAAGQEGHPLTGTWYGDFGQTTGARNDLTVVMKWDGTATTGIVNPGRNQVPLKTARLDIQPGTPRIAAVPAADGKPAQPAIPATMPTFLVHFEVDAKNKAGGVDQFVFQGVIENPVTGNRTIRGTWTCGSRKGNFLLRRL